MTAVFVGDVGRGFDDPTHDSQTAFRAVLDAFAHPGRIQSLASALVPPDPLCVATTAILLTLADRDAPVWLAPRGG